MRWMVVWAPLLVFDSGCGSSAAPQSTGDSGAPAPTDAGAQVTERCVGRQHRCDDSCVPDQPNDPEVGCRLGCGEPCPPVEGGVAICSDEGECAFECVPPAVPAGGGCGCEPATCADVGATCGSAEDGCGGTLSCGACPDGTSCVEGACTCGPDAAEPNEDHTMASSLGDSLEDRGNDEETYRLFHLDGVDDVDWLTVEVKDRTDGGAPKIRVELRDVPEGADYSLGAWFVCARGDDHTDCAAGTSDDALGAGCTSDAAGNLNEVVRLNVDCNRWPWQPDEGRLYIRVAGSDVENSCTPYTIRIKVD